jgi:hypothetical protein
LFTAINYITCHQRTASAREFDLRHDQHREVRLKFQMNDTLMARVIGTGLDKNLISDCSGQSRVLE